MKRILITTMTAACLCSLAIAQPNETAGDIVMQKSSPIKEAPGNLIMPKTENSQPTSNGNVPVFTLTDVIALAIRNNPQLKQDKLSRISQKLDLKVAKYAFEPQYNLEANYNYNNSVQDNTSGTTRTTSFTPGVNYENHYGTKFSLSAGNSFSYDKGGDSNPFGSKSYDPVVNVTVTQPLIQGFGKAIVDAALNAAKDAEEINKLTFQNDISTILQGVINAYFSVITAEQQYAIAKQTLANDETTLKQNETKVKLGQSAPTEVLESQSSVASDKVAIEQQKNAILIAKQTLLQSIGIKGSTPFDLPKNINAELASDEKILSGGQTFPGLQKMEQLALENDLSYQTSLITIRQTALAVKQAKNLALPSLGLTLTHTQGSTEVGGNGGFQGYYRVRNRSNSVGLQFNMPIDDVATKAAVTTAQVGLQNAVTALGQSKLDLFTTVQTDLQNLISGKQQLLLQKQAVALQQKEVANSETKLKYGQISTFQLTTQQQSLTTAENSLATSEQTYLSDLLSLDEQLNLLLDRWHIKVRY